MSIRMMTLVWDHGPRDSAMRLVLLAMADIADDRGVCWPSVATIADRACMSDRNARRILRKLEDDGWLATEVGRGRNATSRYTIRKPDTAMSGQENRTNCPPGQMEHENRTNATVKPDTAMSAEPSRTTIEPSRGGAEGAHATAEVDVPKPAPSLVSQIAEALGFNDPDGIGWPRYWASADAGLIASRWVTDLGLTETEVIHVATANMRAHGGPANGPKTLTRHMQDYASAKAAPPIEIPASRTGDPSHAQTARPSSRGQQPGSGQQFTGIAGAVMRNRLAREQGL